MAVKIKIKFIHTIQFIGFWFEMVCFHVNHSDTINVYREHKSIYVLYV